MGGEYSAVKQCSYRDVKPSPVPVDKDVSEADLEKIAEDPQSFMQSAMLNRAVVDVISDIEDKHQRIM